MRTVTVLVLAVHLAFGLAPAGWCFLGCSSAPVERAGTADAVQPDVAEAPVSCCSRCAPERQQAPDAGEMVMLSAPREDACGCLGNPCCASGHLAAPESLAGQTDLPGLGLAAWSTLASAGLVLAGGLTIRPRERGPGHAGLAPFLELQRLLL